MTSFAHGDVLKKRYILIKMLGSGASATVWLTLDCKNDKFVSLKAFEEEDYDDGHYEINIYNSLSYDLNIMLNSFVTNNKVCIVFPLYGGNLYDVTKNVGLNEELCQLIHDKLKTLIESLKLCEIVHNDIKPENIMFAEPLSKPIQRIIDAFNNNGGMSYYVSLKKSLPNMSKIILNDILNESDYDETLSDAYNSSNESSDSDIEHTNNTEFSDTSSDEFDKTGTDESTSDDEENDKISVNYDIEKVYDCIRNGNIYLIDYGSAYKVTDSDCECIPTRYYRSPEHLQGKKHIGHKADTWSLGCTLFEIHTGSILFDPPKENKSRDEPQLQIIANTIGINNNEYQSDVNKKWISLNKSMKTDIMSLFRQYFNSQ